jgi:hypothetical protein
MDGTFDLADGANCRVAGWARDRNSTQAVMVDVYREAPPGTAGSIHVTTASAGTLRSDLPFADQDHGFLIAFSPSDAVADGQPHAIYIYAQPASAQSQTTQLNGSPKTLQCAGGSSSSSSSSSGGPAVIPAGISSVTYNVIPPDNLINSPAAGSYINCDGYTGTNYYYIPDNTQSYSFRYLPGWPGLSYSVAFITPNAVLGSTIQSAGRFTAAEFSGPPTTRHVTIRPTPCDFSGGQTGNTTLLNFSVGVDPGSQAVVLQPNSLYFFNVTTLFDGLEHCPETGCGQTFEYSPARP